MLVKLSSLLVSASALPSTLASALQTPLQPTSSLEWHDCTQELLQVQNLQCATLSVPVDWLNPYTSEKIHLLVTRLPASGKASEKIGSLIYNPGGPGALASLGVANYARSNSSHLADSFSYLSPEIREKFDIRKSARAVQGRGLVVVDLSSLNTVGPDPRGVGFSTPLLCNGTAWNPRVSRRPQTEKEFNVLVQHNKAIGESCRENSPSKHLVDFMDTRSAARDIDAIRVALGEQQLNYLGFSYGTQLGMTYAELFPQHIRAMVLDGMLDHSQHETDMFVTESQTFERELERFFDWCNTTSECALHGRDASRLFDELVDSAEQTPIPAPGCRKQCREDVTSYELIRGISVDPSILQKISPRGSSGGWPLLSQKLKRAMDDGDATAFSEPLWYPGISEIDANSLWAELGSECQDWLHESKTVADTKYKNQLGQAIAPHTKGVSQTYDLQLRCIGWPTNVTNRPHLSDIHHTPNPILIVNSYHDPSTSYAWAVAAQRQINQSVLLSRDGDGHTSYGLAGEASRIIDRYLTTLEMPLPNTVVES